MNEIVKYHKDFENKLVLKTFTASELNFLMAICTKVKDKKEDEIIFTFNELKNLTKWDNNNNSLFVKNLENTNKKLMALNFRIEDEKEIVQFVLFPTFRVNKDSKTLIVRVNKDFSYLLNNLSNNFNWYQLNDFTSLKSKYSKLLYKELMLFKDTGYRIFKIEDFRRKLDIPEKYRMTNVNQKVLTPIEEDMKHLFKSFRINKIKDGKTIIKIEFYFTPMKKDILKDEVIDKNIIDVDDIKTEPIIESQVAEKTDNALLKDFFISQFPTVNYTKKHQVELEKVLKNNDLKFVKNYLNKLWEDIKNNITISNKEAYFSHFILNSKDIERNYLPADYEELKKETEPIQKTREISSIKDFSSPINLEIPKENEEKKVITRSEYEREKEKWIIEQKMAPVYNEKIALQIFEIKMKNYEIIEDEVKEENIEIKTISRFDYEYKKLEWLEIQKQSNSYNEKMAIRVFEEKMKDYKIIEEDYEEIIAEAKEKYDIEEVILDDDEGGVPNLDFLDNEDDELLELSLKKAEEKKLNELTMKDVENYIKDSPNFLEVIKNLVREEEMKKQQEKNKMKYKDFLEKYSDKLKSKAGKKLTGVALRFKAIALAKKMEIEITDLYKKRGIL